ARDGAVAGLAAMRAEVEAERARLTEAMARAEWERARAELARATGLAADALPPVPPTTLPTRASATVPTVEATYSTAIERRSDLSALRAGIAAARQRRSAESRATLPDVALQLGTMQSAGHSARIIGVMVPLPLLDRNAGGRARAAGALLVAEAELRAAENAARAEATAAVASLSALLAARGLGADSLAARAAEVARVAQAAYAEGGVTLLELLDARRAYAEVLTAALRWSTELRLARLELNRASGAPLTESLETP
ncbi:MAG: TolC family protein, partial [Gemmatirosa sp.]